MSFSWLNVELKWILRIHLMADKGPQSLVVYIVLPRFPLLLYCWLLEVVSMLHECLEYHGGDPLISYCSLLIINKVKKDSNEEITCQWHVDNSAKEVNTINNNVCGL